MGLFSEEELNGLSEFQRNPAVRNAISAREESAIEDVVFENPDRLNDTQERAIEAGVNALHESRKEDKVNIDRSFSDDIPVFKHATRSVEARASDKGKSAPVADTWADWLDSPDRLDWSTVDR